MMSRTSPSTRAAIAALASPGPIAAATSAGVVPGATSRTEPSGSVMRNISDTDFRLSVGAMMARLMPSHPRYRQGGSSREGRGLTGGALVPRWNVVNRVVAARPALGHDRFSQSGESHAETDDRAASRPRAARRAGGGRRADADSRDAGKSRCCAGDDAGGPARAARRAQGAACRAVAAADRTRHDAEARARYRRPDQVR